MPPSKKPKKIKACRVCLDAKSDFRITFDVDSEWSRLMEYCLGISVFAEIGPRLLCKKCASKLKDFSEFKTLALKSETLWNNVVSVKVKKEEKIEIETIEIKDEDDDFPEQFMDVEFLDDIDLSDTHTINSTVIKDESHIDKHIPDSNVVEEQPKVKKIIEIKKENVKKESNKKFKGLSDSQFIKKYFDTIKSKKKGSQPKYVCLNCGDEFARRSALPLHVQKCYNSEVLVLKNPKKETIRVPPPSIFDCGLCNFQNSEEDDVIKHINEEHCLKNDLNCKICDYVGRDMADMISHRFKHIPSDCKYRGKYRCPTCDKIRLNELCLEFHYRSLHLNKAGGWCSVCNKTFTGYIYFRNHMRLHTEAKYICDFCGAKFLFRNLIEAHIYEHMNVRNFICDTCGKSFKRNSALLGHIRAYHTDYKPVPCDHCNKQFKNAYSLRLHMKMVRKGNNFICDVCCKGYPTMSLLKKHMFWHTGERPFACETCGGRYKSKGNLKLHMRKHMGIYPFKCSSCEKQFMTSTQLKAHSSVHTGIRRVKCLVCEKTFHEKRQMLAHCQSKHESFMLKNESQGISIVVPQDTQLPLEHVGV